MGNYDNDKDQRDDKIILNLKNETISVVVAIILVISIIVLLVSNVIRFSDISSADLCLHAGPVRRGDTGAALTALRLAHEDARPKPVSVPDCRYGLFRRLSE